MRPGSSGAKLPREGLYRIPPKSANLGRRREASPQVDAEPTTERSEANADLSKLVSGGFGMLDHLPIPESGLHQLDGASPASLISPLRCPRGCGRLTARGDQVLLPMA